MCLSSLLSLFKRDVEKENPVVVKPVEFVSVIPQELIDFLKTNDGKRTTQVWHHSANKDRYTLDDWDGTDYFHRSFRVDFHIFTGPLAIKNNDDSVIRNMSQNYAKIYDSWYEKSMVDKFYTECGVSTVNGFPFVQNTVNEKFYQSPWRKIGYNIGIERVNGTLVARFGRALIERGCHCPQEYLNEIGIGVLVMGKYDDIAPDKELWDYCVKVAKTIQEVTGAGIIKGHREVKGVIKTCPGKSFDLDRFRREVALS